MWKPATISDSASFISNGARPSSAIAVIMNMAAARGARKKYQIFCERMIVFMLIEPARMVGISMVAIIGTSNETMTATWRKAPIRAYLLLEAQPAMMIESVPIAPAAMI